MLPRYSRSQLTAIWGEQSKFETFFEIELYACEAMEKQGKVPAGTAEEIRSKRSWKEWNVERINEIEATTKHDVIAFLTYISEQIPEARYLHLGMTSSDLLDTALSKMLKEASIVILEELKLLIRALKTRALETQNDLCIGRSHGIHAEPITIGLKLLSFHQEFTRNQTRLESAIEEISVCAISGAVGTYANISPEVEQYVASKLNLKPEAVSTQVIPRDRHAVLFSAFGIIASSVERLATEVRHLQRTEVYEAEEFFSQGQKGSSAMPHKRNPVLTENLTGLARFIRSAVIPAMENVSLWHERDISHSSVERILAPDVTTVLDFALHRLTGVVANLKIYTENALENLNKLKGLIFSQRVLLYLVSECGISRDEAYQIVQASAMKIWKRETDKDFKALLLENESISSRITTEEIENIFDMSYHTKHINHIFKKCLG